MSLFRDSTRQSSLLDAQQSRRPGAPPARLAESSPSHSPEIESASEATATYYDVLKCHGQFATPSAFFEPRSQPLKPAHSSASTFPWAARPADITASPAADAKHRLRRVAAGGSGGSVTDSASSSMFPHQPPVDGSLPPAVFRLPSAAGRERKPTPEEPWALSGMTSGGRALRKANQVKMSRFDRKVTLI